MNVQGVSLSAPSSIIVKGVSIPMPKTVLTGQRVSLSNEHAGCTNSIIVKGVSIPTPKKVLTWQRVSLSTTCSMNVQGVSLSAPNSIIVKGVSIPMPTVLTWQYERAGCIHSKTHSQETVQNFEKMYLYKLIKFGFYSFINVSFVCEKQCCQLFARSFGRLQEKIRPLRKKFGPLVKTSVLKEFSHLTQTF